MTSRDVYFFGNACAFSSRKAVSVPTSVNRRPGGSMATSRLVAQVTNDIEKGRKDMHSLLEKISNSGSSEH